MSINKFQRVVERLMTEEELIERARELKLSNKLTKHIVAVFTNTAEAILDDGEIDEEGLAAGNGRMSLGYDYDDAWHDFAIEAGLTEAQLAGKCPSDFPDLTKVFDAFFAE